MFNYSHLLSRSTSLLLKLFIEVKAFITRYSNEVLYFRRVQIERKTVMIKGKTRCLCRLSLKLSHLLTRNEVSLLKLFIEIRAIIIFYSNEVLHFKRVLMEIEPFIRKNNTLFMQNFLKAKPFIIKK